MTFYLKPTSFTSPNNLKVESNDMFLVKILVDKSERKIYKIHGQRIRNVSFGQQQKFIALSGTQYLIEIKVVRQNLQNNQQLIASLLVRKQDLMRDKHVQMCKNKEIVSCELELKSSDDQHDESRMEKMQREKQEPYKIKLDLKLDRYKQLLGKIYSNTDFLKELKALQQQPVGLQSVHVVQPPRHYHSQVVKLQNTNQKMRQFYIGPCFSKNIFSCLDHDNNQHKYTIVQPMYEQQ